MRAVRVHAHGGPEVLLQQEVAVPAVGPGQVRVAVRACGVNHLDVWVRRGVPGHAFPLPLILGNDVAGVVAEVGSAVDDVQVGDAVVVAPGRGCGHCLACQAGQDQRCADYHILGETCDGGYAEQVVVPRASIFARPAGLDFVQAAALGVAHLTAWHMLVQRAQLQMGETVLIHAAGSGVGSAALQIARLWGARTLAVASTPEKRKQAETLGADVVLPYDAALARAVKSLTEGRGADVVVEHVGSVTWPSSLKSLARGGRLVTCGATTGAEVGIDLRHLFFKAQSILGSTMGSKADFAQVLRLAGAGKLVPVVDRVLPLGEVAAAHAALEARAVFGKVVLVP